MKRHGLKGLAGRKTSERALVDSVKDNVQL